MCSRFLARLEIYRRGWELFRQISRGRISFGDLRGLIGTYL